MYQLPDGRIRILVQGLTRARVSYISQTEPFTRPSSTIQKNAPNMAPHRPAFVIVLAATQV